MAARRLPLAAIADAGPLIHLDELDCLHVLTGFQEVLVPTIVADEATRHRPGWQAKAPSCVRIEDPMPDRLESIVRQLADATLDPGELAAIALWHDHRSAVLLCDDLAARRAAEAAGCEIAGTLGLVLWSARTGRITKAHARKIIAALPTRSTLHLERALAEEAIRSLDENG